MLDIDKPATKVHISTRIHTISCYMLWLVRARYDHIFDLHVAGDLFSLICASKHFPKEQVNQKEGIISAFIFKRLK